MATARPAPAWIRRWLRQPSEPASDWADLGTAFGLNGALEAPPAEGGSSPAAAPRPGRRGWWTRKPGGHEGSGGA